MLIEILIAQMCAGYSGLDREACSKAAEATLIEASVTQNVQTAEKKTATEVQARVTDVTGKEVVAFSLIAAKIVKDKEVEAKLTRNRGITPSTKVTAGEKSGKVTFGWEF